MHRFWIWMIPLLAAICSLCLQAAVHGNDPKGFTLKSTTPWVRPQATVAASYSKADDRFYPAILIEKGQIGTQR